MSRGFASNYRVVLLSIGLFACFAGLGARLVFLHVIDRDELLRNIVKTRRQTTREAARRGDIFDRNFARLATSRPMIVVAVDPAVVRPDDEAKLPRLAELLGLPLKQVQDAFANKYREPAAPKPLLASSGAKPAPAATAATNPFTVKLPGVGAPTKSEADAGENPDPEFAQQMADAGSAKGDADVDPKNLAGKAEDDDTETDGADPQGRRLIRWKKLSDHVSEDTWAQIEKLGIRALCPPERRYARVYPHDELASHIVGFANRENQGSAGIEAYADFYLRGQDGWREGEKDGRQRELAQFQTREIPPVDGYSVVLTIDSTVQDVIERELAAVVKKYQPLKATVIVSDPRSGFILGMANYPTYNPNEYNLIPKDQMDHLRNLAVSDVYEPGSVFKIVAASAALEKGLVTTQTRFDCTTDHVSYRGHDYKLGEAHRFDHPLSVAEIIAHSSNRGAAQLAILVGEDDFEKYARAFGFGSKLGFPVGHESPGLFKTHDKWRPIDMTRIPMGQSIAATALQMHQAMCTIANGGVLMKPQIVREIRDSSNGPVYTYAPVPIRRVVSEQTAHTMARLLQAVASPQGTAAEAAIKMNLGGTLVDFEVAGKTGTSQKYLPETLPSGRVKIVASKTHHVVSFVGFFPASRPQVAISVIVDDADAHAPGGVAYGAHVAGPVFKSIGEKLIPILSISQPNQPVRNELAAVAEGGRR